MKDCFLIRFVSLYTLLHFILLPVGEVLGAVPGVPVGAVPVGAVLAAVPKFVQLTAKNILLYWMFRL